MRIVYINRENGNVHKTEKSMLKEWNDLYDGGDPTNCAIYSDYYFKCKVYKNGNVIPIAPSYIDDYDEKINLYNLHKRYGFTIID